MIAVKAIFRDGQVVLEEPAPTLEPVEVLVVFPVSTVDPWQKILDDPRPRPALSALADEVLAELTQGKTAPLDPDQL